MHSHVDNGVGLAGTTQLGPRRCEVMDPLYIHPCLRLSYVRVLSRSKCDGVHANDRINLKATLSLRPSLTTGPK
jgi:hypothetical protein